jgi:HEAT repeat protein
MSTAEKLDCDAMLASRDFEGLVAALESPDYGRRSAAVRSLTELAPKIKEAYIVAALIAAATCSTELANPSTAVAAGRVRVAAIHSLAKIGDRRAIEPLIDLIPCCNEEEKAAVALALSELGAHPVPEL